MTLPGGMLSFSISFLNLASTIHLTGFAAGGDTGDGTLETASKSKNNCISDHTHIYGFNNV